MLEIFDKRCCQQVSSNLVNETAVDFNKDLEGTFENSTIRNKLWAYLGCIQYFDDCTEIFLTAPDFDRFPSSPEGVPIPEPTCPKPSV